MQNPNTVRIVGLALFIFAIAIGLIVGFWPKISPEAQPTASSMRTSIYIGETPANEPAAQVGSANYAAQGRKECNALIGQLRRTFGDEPGSASLYVKANPHDFSTYYTVECRYDDADEEAMDYAFRCEGEYPEEWDATARAELGLTGDLAHA